METVIPTVLTVGQLNNYIKGIFDGDYRLKNIFLCGEISNFTNHIRTGHFYMTLKDDKAAVKAVMFRSYAQYLKFMPENGMKVIVYGSVSVFERDGQYQLYIENMQPDGLGSLNLAYEQLKEKLEKEGLFSAEHKKALPRYPKIIGVVTSPTGAAFRDICNVLGRRWPFAEIKLCPAQVQGASAPGQIVSALNQLDNADDADVIILARGGGSIEDLWAFNDESVARAIFNCSIPVVTGVGHETDFTIADFAADCRAPTPSAAAEIATPDILVERQRISELVQRSKRTLVNRISIERTSLEKLMSRNVMQGPVQLINERRLILDSYIEALNRFTDRNFRNKKEAFILFAGKLDAYSPLKVLARGYSIAKREDGTVIKSVHDVIEKEQIFLTLSDGEILSEVSKVKVKNTDKNKTNKTAKEHEDGRA